LRRRRDLIDLSNVGVLVPIRELGLVVLVIHHVDEALLLARLRIARQIRLPLLCLL